ncbi:hypothetical protein Droror1_Dr00004583 [Drosera rotundifolia]
MSMGWLSIMSFTLVLMLLEVREIDSIHNYGGTEAGDLQLRGRRALLKWVPEKEKPAKKEFASRGNSASKECYDGTSESTLQVQQHRSSRMPGAPPAPSVARTTGFVALTADYHNPSTHPSRHN